MCLNDVDFQGKPINMNLYGTFSGAYRSIEMLVIPCIPSNVKGHIHHEKDLECVADHDEPESMKERFEKSKAYLGSPSVNIVFN